jgi:hypothetical protein
VVHAFPYIVALNKMMKKLILGLILYVGALTAQSQAAKDVQVYLGVMPTYSYFEYDFHKEVFLTPFAIELGGKYHFDKVALRVSTRLNASEQMYWNQRFLTEKNKARSLQVGLDFPLSAKENPISIYLGTALGYTRYNYETYYAFASDRAVSEGIMRGYGIILSPSIDYTINDSFNIGAQFSASSYLTVRHSDYERYYNGILVEEKSSSGEDAVFDYIETSLTFYAAFTFKR